MTRVPRQVARALAGLSRGRGRTSWSVLLVVALFAILSLAQLHYGLAIAGGVWQTFPSWDNPATHIWEAGAAFTPPYADPARQASEHALAAADQPGRLLPADGPSAAQSLVSSGRLTRSPPRA